MKRFTGPQSVELADGTALEGLDAVAWVAESRGGGQKVMPLFIGGRAYLGLCKGQIRASRSSLIFAGELPASGQRFPTSRWQPADTG